MMDDDDDDDDDDDVMYLFCLFLLACSGPTPYSTCCTLLAFPI